MVKPQTILVNLVLQQNAANAINLRCPRPGGYHFDFSYIPVPTECAHLLVSALQEVQNEILSVGVISYYSAVVGARPANDAQLLEVIAARLALHSRERKSAKQQVVKPGKGGPLKMRCCSLYEHAVC